MGPQGGGGGNNGGGGGGGVGPAGAPMGVYGATNHAVLQSILLAQQRCQQSLSLIQGQIDNGFSAFKVWQQQRFVTLNDNVRRFGGAVQGGFALQDPVQASNGRRVVAQQENRPPNAPDDRNAKLCPNLHTLQDLWEEWKFGVGGHKPASRFDSQERGGHGSKGKKQQCSRQKRVWGPMDRLVREGDAPAEATRKIKMTCGEAASPAFIMNAMGKCGVHPNLVNGPAEQQAAAARHTPFLNAPHHGQGRGRQAVMPADRRGVLAPMFRAAGTPRLMGTSVAVQETLNAQLRGEGTGDATAIFQSTAVRAEIQLTFFFTD